MHVLYLMTVIVTIMCLIGISVSDIRTRRIPGLLLFGPFSFAVLRLVLEPQIRTSHLITGGVITLLVIFYYQACHGHGIGGGDLKLIIAGGLILGPEGILYGLFLSFFLALIGEYRALFGRDFRHEFALAPYLCAGMSAVCICRECGGWFL